MAELAAHGLYSADVLLRKYSLIHSSHHSQW